MTSELSCEVLVVGLGPVGATLAALLGGRGIDVIAIDKSHEVYPLPRAAHFDHEIMRVFQQVGVAPEVLFHVRPSAGYEFRAASGEVLLSFPPAGIVGTGWHSNYMFNQPGVERALRAKLSALPTVRVLLGAELEQLESFELYANATIRSAQGITPIRARYVVGCDGASSKVRERLGIDLDDLKFDEPWLVIDAIPRPGCRLPEINLQICDSARPTTCVLMGPGRHRWEFMLLPGEDTESVLQDAFIQSLLAKWNVEVVIERKAVYRFHGLVAKQWRNGSAFLAGDAAHQMPPFAGQGMCSGIRDAANLAWKLYATLKLGAQDSLLDTYQVEREPNTRAYIKLAIDMGRVVCMLDPEHERMRNESMLAMRRSGKQTIDFPALPPLASHCTIAGDPKAGYLFPQILTETADGLLRSDDAFNAGAWLIGDSLPEKLINTASALGLVVVNLNSPKFAPFRDGLTQWLTAAKAAAVLVRPDRYVFGAGDAEQLVSAWRKALGAS